MSNNTLSTDILHQVLTFFACPEKHVIDGESLRGASLVCKQWRRVVNSKSLWEIVTSVTPPATPASSSSSSSVQMSLNIREIYTKDRILCETLMGFVNLGSFGDSEFGFLVEERSTGSRWVLSISRNGSKTPLLIRDLFIHHSRLKHKFLHPDYTNTGADGELETFPNGLSMYKGRVIRWYRVQLKNNNNKDIVERSDFLRLKGMRLTQC